MWPVIFDHIGLPLPPPDTPANDAAPDSPAMHECLAAEAITRTHRAVLPGRDERRPRRARAPDRAARRRVAGREIGGGRVGSSRHIHGPVWVLDRGTGGLPDVGASSQGCARSAGLHVRPPTTHRQVCSSTSPRSTKDAELYDQARPATPTSCSTPSVRPWPRLGPTRPRSTRAGDRPGHRPGHRPAATRSWPSSLEPAWPRSYAPTWQGTRTPRSLPPTSNAGTAWTPDSPSVVCATAFHWLDPDTRLARVAR